MPKNISQKDKKKIYCAFKIGEIKRQSQYSEIITLTCNFNSFSGNRTVEYEGKIMTYTATALLSQSPTINYINASTKIWIKSKPLNTTESDSEYSIVGRTVAADGLVKLYLTLNKPNYQKIYVEQDGKIFSTSIELDPKTLKGIIPLDIYFPFAEYNRYWKREPKGVDDLTNRLYLKSKMEIDGHIELQFEEI